MNTAKTKAELLAHYATREPTKFVQIDGWSPDQCDGVITDCGGYGLTGCITHELMTGNPRVRVLVVPGTDPDLVLKILVNAHRMYENRSIEGTDAIEGSSPPLRQAEIDALLAQTDIVALIQEQIPLLRKRDGELSGQCPFCDSANSRGRHALIVNPAKQFYHCFDCGAHGTALGWIMRCDGVPVAAAMNVLRERLNSTHDPDVPF